MRIVYAPSRVNYWYRIVEKPGKETKYQVYYPGLAIGVGYNQWLPCSWFDVPASEFEAAKAKAEQYRQLYYANNANRVVNVAISDWSPLMVEAYNRYSGAVNYSVGIPSLAPSPNCLTSVVLNTAGGTPDVAPLIKLRRKFPDAKIIDINREINNIPVEYLEQERDLWLEVTRVHLERAASFITTLLENPDEVINSQVEMPEAPGIGRLLLSSLFNTPSAPGEDLILKNKHRAAIYFMDEQAMHSPYVARGGARGAYLDEWKERMGALFAARLIPPDTLHSVYGEIKNSSSGQMRLQLITFFNKNMV